MMRGEFTSMRELVVVGQLDLRGRFIKSVKQLSFISKDNRKG